MYKLKLPETKYFRIYLERVNLYISFAEHAVKNPCRQTGYTLLRLY